jgi:hypothetical protein
MNNRTFYILSGIIAILLTIVVIQYVSSKKDIVMYQAQVRALNNTVKTYNNKFREHVAEKLVFEGTKKDLEKQLEVWKQTKPNLRAKVTGNTRSVTLLGSQTTSVFSGKTDTVTLIDSIYPVYTFSKTDKWKDLKGIVGKDSFEVKVKIRDEVELITEQVGNDIVVKAISKNPDSETTELKQISIAPKEIKPKMFWRTVKAVGIGVGIGYLITR